MSRRAKILLALLLPVVGFASWQWLRPYQGNADPAAGATIEFARLKRDHTYHWLDLRLAIAQDREHDLRKPVRLTLADGRELEPAETTLEGDAEKRIRHLSLKFWLEPGDLDGPIELQLNDGTLKVRERDSAPPLDDGAAHFFRNTDW